MGICTESVNQSIATGVLYAVDKGPHGQNAPQPVVID